MFINYGSNKCPVCGNFGTKLEEEIFHCHMCGITFNEFSVATHKKISDDDNKMWN